MIARPRSVEFLASALRDLKAFPATARQEAGHQMDLLQQGLEPDDWKPMSSVGPGVCEIRIRDDEGAFRLIYVTKMATAIYVLHCFRKTSQKTSRRDLDLASRRLRELNGGRSV